MLRKDDWKHYVDKDILKEVLEAKWPPAIASGEIDISRVNVCGSLWTVRTSTRMGKDQR